MTKKRLLGTMPLGGKVREFKGANPTSSYQRQEIPRFLAVRSLI